MEHKQMRRMQEENKRLWAAYNTLYEAYQRMKWRGEYNAEMEEVFEIAPDDFDLEEEPPKNNPLEGIFWYGRKHNSK